MTSSKLIKGVLHEMGRDIPENEKRAVASVLDHASIYGYGNMIAWLATAWAQHLRESGVPNENPEDLAGGRCYPLPDKKKT